MKQPTRKVTKVHIKSALPIFAAAGAFLLGMLILPGYRLWAILVSAGLAAGAYFVGELRFFKGRDAELVTDEYTGDRELDALIKHGYETVGRFRAVADSAGDEAVSALVSRIADAADGIVDDVIMDPQDRGDVDTFFSYYLPTLDKLLHYYDQFSKNDFGENARESRKRIEGCLTMVAGSFEKFLDKLYRNDASEISVSIETLKIMLRTDGLAKKEDTKSTPVSYTASQMDAEIESISNQLQSEAEMERRQAVATTH